MQRARRLSPLARALEPPLRVVVVDDHELMRSSLRRLLEGIPGVVVVAEARDLALAQRHASGHQPDVLLLDAHLPDGFSPDAIAELHERAPRMKVIVTSVDSAPALAQRALAAGASAFVLKDRADEQLADALRRPLPRRRRRAPAASP